MNSKHTPKKTVLDISAFIGYKALHKKLLKKLNLHDYYNDFYNN